MGRALEQLGCRRGLDHPPSVHHHHPVGVAGDDTQVVGDEQHRHAELVLQPIEQLENLCLNRHVEGRRGLVGDEDLGVTDERHRDHHALAHASGHLMRIVVDPLLGIGNADELEHLDRAGARRPARQPLMDDRRLRDLIPDGEDGVQGGHWLLENHGDLIAANGAQLGWSEREQIAALEFDQRARQDVARRLGNEPQNRQRRHGLATARLPDDPQRLARIQIEGNLVDRACRAAAVFGDEIRLEIADAQQRSGRCCGHAGSWRGSSASLSPSAMAFSDMTTREIARPANRVVHGAV